MTRDSPLRYGYFFRFSGAEDDGKLLGEIVKLKFTPLPPHEGDFGSAVLLSGAP